MISKRYYNRNLLGKKFILGEMHDANGVIYKFEKFYKESNNVEIVWNGGWNSNDSQFYSLKNISLYLKQGNWVLKGKNLLVEKIMK